tara:strand:+ start:553 stop:726 length:174 start_codon:yes stop_codon:yes gene_type:complete
MCGRFELKTNFDKLPSVLRGNHPIGPDSKYENQNLIKPNDPVVYTQHKLFDNFSSVT